MFVALDRDGTLIEHVPYLTRKEEVRLNTNAALGILKLNRAGIPVVVVTNQPVIGRGLTTQSTVDEIHAHIDHKLAEFGASIHSYYVCPHPFDGICDCRKPKPGLIVGAAASLETDPHTCVIIGDSWRDMHLAMELGIRGLHVQTGPDKVFTPSSESFPDTLSAVECLLSPVG